MDPIGSRNADNPESFLQDACQSQLKALECVRQNLVEMRKHAEVQEMQLKKMCQDNANILNFLTSTIREMNAMLQNHNFLTQELVQLSLYRRNSSAAKVTCNQIPTPHQASSNQATTLTQIIKSKDASPCGINSKSNLTLAVGYLTANEEEDNFSNSLAVQLPPVAVETSSSIASRQFQPRKYSSLYSAVPIEVRNERSKYRSPKNNSAVPLDISEISSIYENSGSFLENTPPSPEDDEQTTNGENILKLYTLNEDAVEKYTEEDKGAISSVPADSTKKCDMAVEDFKALNLGKEKETENLEWLALPEEDEEDDDDESNIFHSTFAVSSAEDCWTNPDLSALTVENAGEKSGFVLVQVVQEAKRTRSGTAKSNVVHFVALLTGEKYFAGLKTYRCNFYKKSGTKPTNLHFVKNNGEESFEVAETDVVSHLPEPTITSTKGRSKIDKMGFKFNFTAYTMG